MLTYHALLIASTLVLRGQAAPQPEEMAEGDSYAFELGSTLYNSDETIKVLQCGLPPELGMEIRWMHNYNKTLPASVTQFGTTLLFGELTAANTGLYDCCGTTDGKQWQCVRNRAIVYGQEEENVAAEPDADGNVPLAMGYRYSVMPFSEEVLLRDCRFSPAFERLDVPSNTFIAGPMLGIDVVDIGNYGTYNCIGRRRNELVSKTINIVPMDVDSKDVA